MRYPVKQAICKGCQQLLVEGNTSTCKAQAEAFCKEADARVLVPTDPSVGEAPATGYANPPRDVPKMPEADKVYPCWLKYAGYNEKGFSFYVNVVGEEFGKLYASARTLKALQMYTRNICSVWGKAEELPSSQCVWLLSHTTLRNEFRVTFKYTEGYARPLAYVDFGYEKEPEETK